MKMFLFIALLLSPVLACAAACLAIDGDRVLAADVARQLPAFSTADPEAVVVLAPAPGLQRVLHRAELARIASRLGVLASIDQDLCIERVAAPLGREQVEAALAAALAGSDANFDLVEFSRLPVPHGRLEFTRAGLLAPGRGREREPVVWRGRVKYSGTQSVPVWAKVVLKSMRQRVVADVDLIAGQPIAAAQLRVESVEEFPFGESFARETGEIAGKLPRRTIRRGESVRMPLLALPKDVLRGETVEVTVESGSATLSFTGKVETSGQQGDRVLVKNPENGQRFAARVEAKGKVSVKTDRRTNAL
jgi:flagellar basal body P-ring formation protein FlgA